MATNGPAPLRPCDRYRFAPVYLAVLLVGTLPVFFPEAWRSVCQSLAWARPVFWIVTALLPLGLVITVCRALPRRAEEPALVGVPLALLAALLEYLHFLVVDLGHYFPREYAENNLHWQVALHQRVLALAPDALPHSYRFLPNGLVALLEGLTGDFFLAKTVYRFAFTFGLLCLLYLLARRYVARAGAVVAVVFCAAVFPVGIACYAGQLTDPLSHFSFLLALWFLRLGRDLDFLATLLVGLLAKEAVLAVAVCYLVAAVRRGAISQGLWRTALYTSAGFALLMVVRVVVVGDVAYDKVSGVGMDHVWRNLTQPEWPLQLLFSVGVFLPVLVIHWRGLPADLRDDIVVLLPALLLSSLLFSWLAEARNYMPVTALLCVAAARFLEDRFFTQTGS